MRRNLFVQKGLFMDEPVMLALAAEVSDAIGPMTSYTTSA